MNAAWARRRNLIPDKDGAYRPDKKAARAWRKWLRRMPVLIYYCDGWTVCRFFGGRLAAEREED